MGYFSGFHLRGAASRSDRLLPATWAVLFWPKWPAAVDPIWTLQLLDEKGFIILLESRNAFTDLTMKSKGIRYRFIGFIHHLDPHIWTLWLIVHTFFQHKTVFDRIRSVLVLLFRISCKISKMKIASYSTVPLSYQIYWNWFPLE